MRDIEEELKHSEERPPPTAEATRSPRRRTLQNIGLVFASIVFTLLLAEGVARVYGAVADVEARSGEEFVRTRPPPYEGSPYFTGRFLRESAAIGGLKTYHRPAGKDYLVPGDYRGRYVNIVDGIRQTTDQPATYRSRVLLFGGSTVFGADVPDNYTIASELQRRLNAAFPNQYIVVNYGAGAANVRQQTERLREIDLSPQDIVVFYDGANEAVGGVYLGDPTGTIYDTEERSYSRLGFIKRFIVRTHDALKEHSHFVRFWLTPVPAKPKHLEDPQRVGELAEETAGHFHEHVLSAHEYVTSQGAEFVHFLQPTLFSGALTEYERELVDNQYVVVPGAQEAFERSYPLLGAANERLQSEGVRSIDLTSLLESRSSPDEEFFLDCCHVTEGANARIAEALFSNLRAQ